MINFKYNSVTVEQINKMCHALGIKRDRQKYKTIKSYRNYYQCHGDNPFWDPLVELGLATKRPDPFSNSGFFIFHVSVEGIKFLEGMFGIKIDMID